MSSIEQTLQPYIEKLRKAVGTLIESNQRVVIAVSGGIDSTALLRGMCQIEQPQNLVVAHFNHRLRIDSEKDADFACKLAAQHGLEFHLAAAESDPRIGNQPLGGSLENWARERRYQFLQQVAAEAGSQFVATAHTADDQVETVLFRLMRGTGMTGLAGMRPKRALSEHVQLVRPLLGFRRVENERYLVEIGQSALADASNQSLEFSRNRIRNSLLPMMRNDFNGKVDEALLRVADQARQFEELLTAQATALLHAATITRVADEVFLHCDQLASAPELVAGQAIVALFDSQKWPRREIGAVEIARILELCRSETENGTSWNLPNRMIARRVNRAKSMLWIAFGKD